MMHCKIQYRKKDFYFKSDDLWKTFSEITVKEYNVSLNSAGGNKRYVKLSKIAYVTTSNFWKTYQLVKKEINEQELKNKGFIDDSQNKDVIRRYCLSDGEYVVTDDFWKTFYFSKYHGGRILDNSKVLKNRISVIDNNNKYVMTDDFYKNYTVFKDNTSRHLTKEQKTDEIKLDFKNHKFWADYPASNPQKKCLCYSQFGYSVGKAIMIKLDEIHLNKTPKSNSGYGDEFEIFAMQRIMHNDDVLNNIVKDSKDGKIDAIFNNSDGTALEMFQIKFLTEVEPNHLITMKQNADLAVDKDRYEELMNSQKKASDLKKFMDSHREYFNLGYRLNIISTPIYDLQYDENQEYSLIDDGNIFKVKFYDATSIVLQYVKDYLMGNLGERKLSIPCTKYVKAEHCDDYFLFVNAKDLCNKISESFSSREEIDELFINNVRGYLGENPKMINTIQSEDSTKFALYNNGVSICCREVNFKSVNKYIVLKNPFIVNGQQTVLTLYSEFENGTDLSKIEVPLFIKPYNTDVNQMLNVAIYNNTQNPVKEIDLLCGDLNVRKIARKIINIDCAKHNESFNDWLTLKMFSTGSNSNIEISSLVIPPENIIAVNDYFKILLPIILHYKTKDGNIDMQLNKFNKNTTKYKAVYLSCLDEIKYFLELDNDFYYKIAECAKKAKDYVRVNTDFLPAENIYGIACFYGVNMDVVSTKLMDLGYSKKDPIKDRITFLCNSETCTGLQQFLIAGKKWVNDKIESE